MRSSGFNSPPPELEVEEEEEEEAAEAEVWMRKRQKTGAGLLQALKAATRTCRSEGRAKASTLANSKLFARLVRLEVDEGHLAAGPSACFATRCGCLAAVLAGQNHGKRGVPCMRSS